MVYEKITLPVNVRKPILAFGADGKNRICFARGHNAFVSTVLGNLSNPEDLVVFAKEIKLWIKKKPKILACDLHPEYISSKYAASFSTAKGVVLVQHHHAHIASCMADNGLTNQKVIGVAFDGTGFGAEENIWGAEFLICDYKDFKRKAHLLEVPLLGGERAILEPARVACAWLYSIYGENFSNAPIKWIKHLYKTKWPVLRQLYVSGINSPNASSMGRLFDAVASIVLGRETAGFEAELAIELEKLALKFKLPRAAYRYKARKIKETYVLDPAPIFKGIISDLKKGKRKEEIASKFHITISQMVVNMCLVLRKQTGINIVVLSGGVFQNKLLLAGSLDLLCKSGFRVYKPDKLSCSDSGIALGQAIIANSRS